MNDWRLRSLVKRTSNQHRHQMLSEDCCVSTVYECCNNFSIFIVAKNAIILFFAYIFHDINYANDAIWFTNILQKMMAIYTADAMNYCFQYSHFISHSYFNILSIFCVIFLNENEAFYIKNVRAFMFLSYIHFFIWSTGRCSQFLGITIY